MLKLKYMDITSYILLAFGLGFLPPAFWLWFWLREDAHPEPKKEVLLVFFAGAGAVLAALVLENTFFTANISLQKSLGYTLLTFQFLNILGFAFIEELVKTGAAFFTALKSRYFDEPVDAMIYLVTAALGFAALENVLFIAESLKSGVHQSILVSSFRFINAALLHASASAIIGAGLAFSFFHKERRLFELILGITLATLLHALYNFFIIGGIGPANGAGFQVASTLLVVFGAMVALLLFERARRTSLYS